MRKISAIGVIILILMMLAALLFGCEPQESYTDATVRKIRNMERPIVLVGSTNTLGGCSILLRDANGFLLYVGDITNVSSLICDSYSIGDTIK